MYINSARQEKVRNGRNITPAPPFQQMGTVNSGQTNLKHHIAPPSIDKQLNNGKKAK